jgi:hypothetical protein
MGAIYSIIDKNARYCSQSCVYLGSLRCVYAIDVVSKNANICSQGYSCLAPQGVFTLAMLLAKMQVIVSKAVPVWLLKVYLHWKFCWQNVSDCCHGCVCLGSLSCVYTDNVVSKNASDSCQSCFCLGSLRCLRWQCFWQKRK